MGRPLYSTLIATAEPVVHVAEAKTPTYERWSPVNAFDPDADEFFEGDNAVYEAFLSPEEMFRREQEQQTLASQTERIQLRRGELRERIIQTLVAAGEMNQMTGDMVLQQNAQLQRPELVEDDSASSSEGSSSGRVSPSQMAADFASQMVERRQEIEPLSAEEELDNLMASDIPNSRHSISLPGTPPYVPSLLLDSLLASGDIHEDLLTFPIRSAPIPIPPSPQATSTVMTPPGSVTPRFLNWSSRPRAVPMSPSPTPDAPFGSLRASRMMAVPHIAPVRVGVQL